MTPLATPRLQNYETIFATPVARQPLQVAGIFSPAVKNASRKNAFLAAAEFDQYLNGAMRPLVLPSTLFLVVGPSGAGKDTLIDAARHACTGDRQVVFPRRIITRPSDAGGENHIGVTDDEFDSGLENSAFSLHWAAHGLRYALPASVGDDLSSGRSVVANVSRSVVADACGRYGNVRVLYVTASPAVLAGRLVGRGRETASDIHGRLTRESPEFPGSVDIVKVCNDGSLADTVSRFLGALAARPNPADPPKGAHHGAPNP